MAETKVEYDRQLDGDWLKKVEYVIGFFKVEYVIG